MIGTVHTQWKRCGKPNCRCRNGQLHGPYYYHFWRENGRLRKRYLKPNQVDGVRVACAKRQQLRRELKACMEEFRALRAELRGLKDEWKH
jgi:hypothetical protein